MSAPVHVPGQDPALDAQTQFPLVAGITISFVAASSITVLLRLYTRCILSRAQGLEDLMIGITQIMSLALAVDTMLQVKFALGRHVWMTTEEGQLNHTKALFAAIVIYNLAQILVKISLLLQYRRLFAHSRTRQISMAMIIFLSIWGVVQEVLLSIGCFPMGMFAPGIMGWCLDPLKVWYATSSMNIVTDFIVFGIPLPVLNSLQLRAKPKVLLMSVFCLGFFACIISIVRLFALKSAVNSADPTWDNVPAAIWSVIELNCGIMCASLPTLRPLMRKIFPWLSRSHGSSYKSPFSNGSRPAGAVGLSGRDQYDVYPLQRRDAENGGSQEGLKENAAGAYYDPLAHAHGLNPAADDEYNLGRDNKSTPKVTVAIYGGTKDTGRIAGLARSVSPDDPARQRDRSQQIMVTREIGIEESTKSEYSR